jgi:PilZ domain
MHWSCEPTQVATPLTDMIMIPNGPLPEKRADQRFSFFADAEVTLCDGTSVPTQVAELSSRGCYIGTLLPIPVGTEIRLHISDGIRTCELQGKVVYLHSSSGLGIFGMGVQLENIATQQRSVIDAWLHDLARKRTAEAFDSA